MGWDEYIPLSLQGLYEIHDYKHAAAILANEFKPEFVEICSALETFRFTISDITESGGNESRIPKRFSNLLRHQNWKEKQLNAKLIVDEEQISIDSHKVSQY